MLVMLFTACQSSKELSLRHSRVSKPDTAQIVIEDKTILTVTPQEPTMSVSAEATQGLATTKEVPVEKSTQELSKKDHNISAFIQQPNIQIKSAKNELRKSVERVQANTYKKRPATTGFFGGVGYAFGVVGLVFLVAGIILFIIGGVIIDTLGALFIGFGLVFLLIWLVLAVLEALFGVIL